MGVRLGGGDCSSDGCDRPARRNGRCYTHQKRLERGMPVDVVVPERPRTPQERVYEAALTYANAETDDEFRRAKDNFRKSVVAAAPAMRADEISFLTKAAMEKLRAEGVKLGRPSKVQAELVEQTVQELGGIAKAAHALRVSVSTVFRHLRRDRSKRGPF